MEIPARSAKAAIRGVLKKPLEFHTSLAQKLQEFGLPAGHQNNPVVTIMRIDYNELAEEYGKYRTSDAAVLAALVRGSFISSASRVLEIGCGAGNYIAELQKRVGCECFGVDPAEGMIAQAKKRHAQVAFSVASAEHLGLPERAFHFVFSVDVIHHVTDRAAYFTEAFRVLRPEGLLATVTDSEDTIRRRMPLAFYFPETIEPEVRRYPRIEELVGFAEQAGFERAGQEVVERPYELTDAETYARKAFSSLRLISENAFATGMARLNRDLENGPIACVSRSFIVWNKKPSHRTTAAKPK